jgi:predicted dehydrogenase
MNLSKYLSVFALAILIASCGPKEVKKVCAAGVRKDFIDGPITANVEEGCVIKFDTPNLYGANGAVNLKIASSDQEVTINLTKGTLKSKGGDFIIKSDLKTTKIRQIAGQGAVIVGEKTVQLEQNKVLEIGG